jgi:hypothetical protein
VKIIIEAGKDDLPGMLAHRIWQELFLAAHAAPCPTFLQFKAKSKFSHYHA